MNYCGWSYKGLWKWSCRIYGLRKYKKNIKEDEEVEKNIQNRD